MNSLPDHTAEAIRCAARLHQRPDGTFSRSGLRQLAAAHEVSERTVRRLAADLPAPVGVTYDPRDEALTQALDDYSRGEKTNMLLLSLTVGAGNMTIAHAYAQDTFGYDKGYRTFVRHIDRLDPALTAAASRGYQGLVENRLYLSQVIPHRNHTWYVDHTMADIFVLPDRGDSPFRPWLSVVVDGATGMYVAVEAWDGHLNTERFTQTITRAAVGGAVNRGETPEVGGLPNVIVCDNAKEHLAHAVTEGAVRLGIVVSPTTPHHSWENGRVEIAHQAIAKSFLATLPGYTKGGQRPDGTPRFAPPPGRALAPTPADKYPTPLLRMSQFQALLEEYRITRNATVTDSRGLTPMDKWTADSTPLTHIDYNVMLANLTTTHRLHTVHKSGIRFRNRDYISAELAPYRRKKLTVRYLATVTEWIEVFDDTTYVGRAWLADHLSEAERAHILTQRQQTEAIYRQVEHQARQHRVHFAHAVNEGWDPDSLPDGPRLIDAITTPADAPGEAPEAEDTLPVIRTTDRQARQSTDTRQARADLAERVLGEGFTLEGDPS